MAAAKGRRILYQATAEAIRAQIASGELAPGEQVGASLDALAAQHHVGKGTMRAALAVLSAEGLAETIPGKGTFVLAGVPGAGLQDGQDAIARRVEAAEVDIMELYAKLGYEQPSHQQDAGSGKERREHAG
jgi:DNA-binding GntR family transcriptional regulator